MRWIRGWVITVMAVALQRYLDTMRFRSVLITHRQEGRKPTSLENIHLILSPPSHITNLDPALRPFCPYQTASIYLSSSPSDLINPKLTITPLAPSSAALRTSDCSLTVFWRKWDLICLARAICGLRKKRWGEDGC